MTNRREFLSTVLGSSAVLSLTGATPGVFSQTAWAANLRKQDRVLVVVQMTGGNDGLNTVVPHTHSVYKSSRKKLRIDSSDALAIDKSYGLHPEMTGFAGLLEAGQLGIVPSVGYPDPNRSHFESMDIWHTCRRKTEKREAGWLGDLLEKAISEADGLSGMHVGGEKQPLAMIAKNLRIPSIESLERFRLNTSDNKRLGRVLEQALAENKTETSDNDLLGFLTTSTQTAVAADKRLEKLRDQKSSNKGYPESRLGRKLAMIGRLIKADMPTRVYYVAIDGFDTHARQGNAHGVLLRHVSDSIAALVKDLNAAGHGDRTLVMSFSEFGRRVAENASEGTDHGTAGPLFLAGKAVKAGFLGPHSNLNKLKDGDLRFRTDFRNVYASLIQDWFGYENSSEILGSNFKPTDLGLKPA